MLEGKGQKNKEKFENVYHNSVVLGALHMAQVVVHHFKELELRGKLGLDPQLTWTCQSPVTMMLTSWEEQELVILSRQHSIPHLFRTKEIKINNLDDTVSTELVE